MSLFIRELSLYKKVLTLSLRVWTSTTLSNSLSRGLSLFLRVQTLRYRVIESCRVLFFTVQRQMGFFAAVVHLYLNLTSFCSMSHISTFHQLIS